MKTMIKTTNLLYFQFFICSFDFTLFLIYFIIKILSGIVSVRFHIKNDVFISYQIFIYNN